MLMDPASNVFVPDRVTRTTPSEPDNATDPAPWDRTFVSISAVCLETQIFDDELRRFRNIAPRAVCVAAVVAMIKADDVLKEPPVWSKPAAV